MKRSRKLLTAGAILFIGLALSWPFRQAHDTQNSGTDIPDDTIRAGNGDPIAFDSPAPSFHKVEVPVAPEHVSARMASTNESPEQFDAKHGLESFDLANHPTLQNESVPSHDAVSPEAVGATTSDARPAYSVTEQDKTSESSAEWPREALHVVRNGDTLEGLAERYLDDAGRGLEIFDLNRDQLSNPYLLPIGVELRIPHQVSRLSE